MRAFASYSSFITRNNRKRCSGFRSRVRNAIVFVARFFLHTPPSCHPYCAKVRNVVDRRPVSAFFSVRNWGGGVARFVDDVDGLAVRWRLTTMRHRPEFGIAVAAAGLEQRGEEEGARKTKGKPRR